MPFSKCICHFRFVQSDHFKSLSSLALLLTCMYTGIITCIAVYNTTTALAQFEFIIIAGKFFFSYNWAVCCSVTLM